MFSVDIIHGKLDQRKKQLEVDYTIGRDIKPDDVKKIADTLKEWCDSCESVLNTIENQIDRANSAKGAFVAHNEKIDQEVRSPSSQMHLFPTFTFIFNFYLGDQIENGPESARRYQCRDRRRNGHGLQGFQLVEFEQYVDASARFTQ